MYETRHSPGRMDRRGGLATPLRNNFFPGKMMDVYQFELETAYGISMRRLLNRLVVGDGVVCGLDVVQQGGPASVAVTSGVAIDGWGREIVVPADTRPIAIPPALLDRICGDRDQTYGDTEADTGGRPGPEAASDEERATRQRRSYDYGPGRHDDRASLVVTLCYHECESDPVAVLAGDCSTTTPCAPGSIREQYRIGFEPGRADPVDVSCRFPDILQRGELDHGALARWVTRECPDPPRNPCIPLANVTIDCAGDDHAIEEIDIEIRPVVFGNPILFDMLSRIVEEERSGEQWRR